MDSTNFRKSNSAEDVRLREFFGCGQLKAIILALGMGCRVKMNSLGWLQFYHNWKGDVWLFLLHAHNGDMFIFRSMELQYNGKIKV